MSSNPRRLLDLVIPFRFLPAQEKDTLAPLLRPVRAVPFEWIIHEGSAGREIFLLEEGQVELMYEDAPFVKPANVVRPGHYFGERAALLDQIRAHGVRAVTDVLCWALPGEHLIQLVGRYSIFAQSFGTILRDKHGIFLPLERFHSEVVRSLAQGYFRMEQLVTLYRELNPAMHPFLHDEETLDLAALSYAVRRLPDNVTTTFAWFFTDDIPVLYSEPQKVFPVIPSQARRRDVWEMMPGKNMVLLRNGVSDILDFLSCLCLFAIESQKIRKRLHDPGLLRRLKDCRDDAESRGYCPDEEDFAALFEGFPFTEAEARALHGIWGGQILDRLYEITVHHEDWAMAVERQLNNYNSRRSEKWANLVSKGVKDFLGLDPWELPDEFEVHVVSSNTHSVTNCLSPFPREMQKAVMDWAGQKRHPFLQLDWENPQDLIYGLLADYFKEEPARRPSPELESRWGILRLDDQATTGIAVQLIDANRLTPLIDGGLPNPDPQRRILIVNIDYAFGEQAEEIIRNLITLFPRHIRSVNILGKAGALAGRRGDILAPTAFIHQSDDSFLPLPESPHVHRLQSRLKSVQVHRGPLLTVEGTLLQNRALLHFYRNLWKCIGLEMEGVFYARQVIESMELEVLARDVVQRYYYYVSDLPLDEDSQLSQPLSASEGIPPLYAITREILTEIFTTVRS